MKTSGLRRLEDGTLTGATVKLQQPLTLRPEDQASSAMTDLRSGRPMTVPEDERLDAALQRMIHALQ